MILFFEHELHESHEWRVATLSLPSGWVHTSGVMYENSRYL